MDDVAVSLFGFWGPEGTRGVSNSDRVMLGGILDVQVTDKAEVVLEGYFGNQANSGAGGANARWNGVAGYFIYDFTDQWGARVRAEVFEDAAGFFSCANATGTANGAGNALVCAAGSTAAQTLWEMTYTLQFKPAPNLITRAEFRYDKSDQNTFQDGAGVGNNKSTLAFEGIFLFSKRYCWCSFYLWFQGFNLRAPDVGILYSRKFG